MIPQALLNCELGPPAPESELAEAERRLGSSLPADYRAFLRMANGAEGFVAPDVYLALWPAFDIAELNDEYAVSEFLPNVTLIGTDGSGTGYGVRLLDGRVEYCSTPLVGMGPANLTMMGENLAEFTRRLCAGPGSSS